MGIGNLLRLHSTLLDTTAVKQITFLLDGFLSQQHLVENFIVQLLEGLNTFQWLSVGMEISLPFSKKSSHLFVCFLYPSFLPPSYFHTYSSVIQQAEVFFPPLMFKSHGFISELVQIVPINCRRDAICTQY